MRLAGTSLRAAQAAALAAQGAKIVLPVVTGIRP
jgi:hypothetical protein